jgi:aminoglycoside phosphotransferase (APT) family kinase protein
MVEKAFEGLKALEIAELTEGFFNVAYLIKLSDGRDVILKIAPPKEAIIMTHEKNIMCSEVETMRMVTERTKVPVARVLYYDNSKAICESDYFFMEKLSGKSFNVLRESLNEEEQKKINFQTGVYNRQINSIHGTKFGYYGQPDKQGNDWYQVFRSMMQDVVDDAARLSIVFGAEVSKILELLERDKNYFMEVTVPKLVHWDLWAGNVFVVEGTITGFIDFERCLWGDELMEVGFRTYDKNQSFLDGYGIGDLTKSQTIRAKWYDVYLLMIATLECDYRLYEDRGMYEWGTSMTREWIKQIEDRINE